MNLEETSTISNCQGKTLNGATPKISEEVLSPTRRSNRIRKPKISVDYCSIDEAIDANKAIPEIKEVPSEKSKQSVKVANNSEVNFIDNKGNKLSKSHKSLEKNSSFFHLDSDEEGSFESMFDDIFGQRYSKTLQSLLPKKLSSESLKERKFFKRNSLEAPKVNFSQGYVCNKSNLPAEDVDKVFKIISKPSVLSDISSDSKSGKPSLKTYCNKRKNFQKSNVVESFGLPDYPVISENASKPIPNNKLDADVLDASEITILDLKQSKEPWVVANLEDENLFPFYEEVRIKADPVKHEYIRKNSSFMDLNCSENTELCSELEIYASTPRRLVNDNILEKIKGTPLNNALKNRKIVLKEKEIDIEAIKINFKKMLNRNVQVVDSSQSDEKTRKENKVKVKRNISPRKKHIVGESKHLSFIESDCLTIENKEFEISDPLPVPKKSESKCQKDTLKDSSPLRYSETKEESKSINEKRLMVPGVDHLLTIKQETVANKERIKLHQSSPQKTKKVVKSTAFKNKISTEDVGTTNVKVGKSPKNKFVETDFLFTKHSLRSLSSKGKQSEQKKDNKRCKEENKKRSLRSSLSSTTSSDSVENLSNAKINDVLSQPREKNVVELIDQGFSKGELLLNNIIKTQNLQKHLNSSINFTSGLGVIETPVQVNLEETLTNITSSNEIIACKRKLRSSSQENSVQEKLTPKANCLKNNGSIEKKRTLRNYINEEIKTDVKVNLEKLKFKSDINTSLNKYGSTEGKGTKLATKPIEDLSEYEDMEKMMSPLKKGKQSIPEIRIIIRPLDDSQLSSKVPKFIGNVSPIKRKLRSTKVNAKESIVESGDEYKKSPPQDKDDSPRENGVPNTVAAKSTDAKLSENNKLDLVSVDDDLNEGISTNMTNNLGIAPANGENGENSQKNFSKHRSPRKSKRSSNKIPSMKDLDKKITNSSSMTGNIFELINDAQRPNCIVPNSDKSKREVVSEKLVINTTPKKDTLKPLGGSVKADSCDFDNIDNDEAEVLNKSKNTEQDQDKKIELQEFDSNKLPVSNVAIVSNTEDERTDNMSNCRMEEQKEVVKSILTENEEENKEIVENDNTITSFIGETIQINLVETQKTTELLEVHDKEERIIPLELSSPITKKLPGEGENQPIPVEVEKKKLLHNINLNLEGELLMERFENDTVQREDQKGIRTEGVELCLNPTSETPEYLLEQTIDKEENTEQTIENRCNTVVPHNENKIPDDVSCNLLTSIIQHSVSIDIAAIEESDEECLELSEIFEKNTKGGFLRKSTLTNTKEMCPSCSSEESDCDEQKMEEADDTIARVEHNNMTNEESYRSISGKRKRSNKKNPKTKEERERFIFSPRLREKQLKSVAGETNSFVLEGSSRRKDEQSAKYLKNSNEKRDNVTANDKKHKSRRRKSISDIDAIDSEREQYRIKLRRSKSVIMSALDAKKRNNDKNDKMAKKTGNAYDNFVKEVEERSTKLRRTKNIEKIDDKTKTKQSKEKNPKETDRQTNNEDNINLRNELEHDTDYRVGDLAWAQIGSHPFWPCLVTEEPETGLHSKIIIFKGKWGQRIFYHVRFFGDKGRRAWINKHQMLLYSNRNDLEVLSDKMKAKNNSPTLLQACIIKPNKLRKWEGAVNEAEYVKSKSLDEKISYFFNILASKAEKRQKDCVPTKKESLLVNRKRKARESQSEENFDLSSNTDSVDERSPSRKRFKKELQSAQTDVDDGNVEPSTSKKNIEIDNEINHIIEDPEPQNESMLTRLRLKKQIDEISEIDSKTSSDTTTDTSSYSIVAQKALFKRNNLFKGVPRDKVCQYCCQPEAVLKCKGRCNGSYHIDCAKKILQETFGNKRRRGRPCNDSLVQDFKFLYERNVKHEDNPEPPKNDKSKQVLLEDDQVQIITVPSSVYNTPPRKTFPPNFKNMSLAEQIDYKMKEIMRKFETKTVYAESSTDSSSEDNSSISKMKQFCTTEALSPNMSTLDKDSNVLEEKKPQEEQENEITRNEDKPSKPRLVENKNIDVRSEKSLRPIIKQKPFVAHVTADSESIDSLLNDIKEEDKSTVAESTDFIELNPKNFKCGFCTSDLDPFCFICNQAISKRGSNIRQKCSLYQCGRFYHPQCLKMWPQTQWSLIQTTKHKDSDEAVDSFVCPLHVCHTCASDDPRAAMSRCSADKIVKCLRCPSTYHSTNFCVPAGTTILSSSQIICPRHREKSKMYTINTTWCFLCSEGGNLICCETCPTSVHPECLPVNLTEDDKFICEDCESGRLPLYDEIVWVKLGKFRWWPALILFPNEIPDNIMNIKHTTGEFVVKFFGTYDHYWVNRGRSFLFQEGDTGHCNSVKKKVDAAFNTAVEEAVIAHKSKKEFKLSQEAESITSLKPPPYIRIKVNKPVGNVRLLDLDLSSTTACECDPSQPNPCGPDSDCLNRLLLTECSPDVCPAGNRCKNQLFDRREYPPLVPYKTQGRGWGLKTLAPIKKGQFVIEYVGEMIDIEEYQRRIQKMHEQKEENYYFLTIDKDRMLDAGPKGNVARFMNHCCQPNCETQKWTVNGDTRVGLFATEDISADTELTFNYNLECVGKEKKVCRCGAPNCSGFIGVKAKQDGDPKKRKKSSCKKKKHEEPVILPPCFICGEEGDVGACNNKVCNNTYHLKCLKIMEWPEGQKFICPWHNCNICSKRTIRCCVKCINSFCPSHSDGNIRYDNLLGFVCDDHDPIKTSNDEESLIVRWQKSNIITDEMAVTSTTTDESEGEDEIPLSLRIEKYKRKKVELLVDWESDDFKINKSVTSTPLKKHPVYSEDEFQDDSTVSSATMTDVEENIVVVRKRGRPKKGEATKKKLKLSDVQSHESTASSSLKDDSSLGNNTNCELSSSLNELENR